MAIAATLLCLIGTAEAVGQRKLPATPDVLARYRLGVPGCYATGAALGAKGEAVTFARASTATYVDAAGVVQTCSSGQLRVTPTGALIEAAATNLCLRSSAFVAAPWGITRFNVSSDSVVAPDGTMTADTLTANNADSYFNQPFSHTSGQPYTFSIWLKVPSGTLTLTIYQFTTGGGSASKSVTLNTSWQRVFLTHTPSATASGTVQVGGATLVPAGTVLHAWGAQLETGSVVTTYIPTTTVTASRSADVASVVAPTAAIYRSWTVDGSRTYGAVTGGATITLPSGTVNTVKFCKSASADRCR